jgi:hydroxyacylglutathione hydrolase
MPHVVSQPNPPFQSRTGKFEVHQVPAAHDNLVWLLVCLETRAAAVVDGPDAEAVLAYTTQHGIELTTLLNTHTHGDHIGINRDLARRGLIGRLEVIGPASVANEIPGLTRGVDEGDEIEVGRCKARVLRTEGHLPGHICFLFDDVLFSGDTLFTGGCGRLFTGDFAGMFASLSRLAKLPVHTRVCCAHEYTEDNLAFALSVEPENRALKERASRVRVLRARGGCAVPSTLGEELATNPMLRWDSQHLIRHLREQTQRSDLSTPEAVFTATRKLKDTGAYKQRRPS